MILWLVASAIGTAVGLLGYMPAFRARGAFAWLAVARAVATTAIAAVALGAPLAHGVRTPTLIVLDRSASWTRGGDTAAFRGGADSAARVAAALGGRAAAVGESLRALPPGDGPGQPADRASHVSAAVDSAAFTGTPLVVVTDGEIDDAAALVRAPAGSRAIVLRPARGHDAAVIDVDAPSAIAPGDSATVVVTIAADSAGAASGRVALRLDGTVVAERAVPALGMYGRMTVAVRVPIAVDARARTAVLTAVVTTAGDRDARNDTASRALVISDAPHAVVVSTTPDYDAGVAFSVLRGALAVPARAYFRVAPGTWRVAGSLAPVSEREVRAAAAAARVLVLHGDTAVFGAPRTFARGALALVPVGGDADSTTDWYARPSPVAGPLAALAGVSWDSLPPVTLSSGAADANGPVARLADRWTGVVARAGRQGAARAIVAGGVDAGGRRIAVVAAGGFWRWAFRGGAGASGAQALWGALFDWLADASPGPRQAIAPVASSVRSGEPVAWRGVPRSDSAVVVRVARRGSRDTVALALHRSGDDGAMRSDSPQPGVYDVPGGGVLVVNASAELVPRRPSLRSGRIGAVGVTASAPAAPIAPGWPLGVATLLLCAEWGARRRLGLR